MGGMVVCALCVCMYAFMYVCVYDVCTYACIYLSTYRPLFSLFLSSSFPPALFQSYVPTVTDEMQYLTSLPSPEYIYYWRKVNDWKGLEPPNRSAKMDLQSFSEFRIASGRFRRGKIALE